MIRSTSNMGLGEGLAKVWKIQTNSREKQRKAQQFITAQKFVREVDKAVDIEKSVSDLKNDLNAHKSPHTPSWEMYHVTPTTFYLGKNIHVNGWPEGIEGYVLLRRLSRRRSSPIEAEDRYSYIFVGRTFEGFPVGARLVPKLKEESAEKITVRAGETARFANSVHTVSSKQELFQLIAENSAILLDSYGSVFSPSQINIGNVQEIRQNVHNNAWKTTARDSLKARLQELIFGKEDKEKGKQDGIEEYNRKHKMRSLY